MKKTEKAIRSMPARLMSALSEPNRIAILARLSCCSRPQTVTELTACCPRHASVVSRHLAVLRDAGALAADKRGREVYYNVRADELARTFREIADAIEKCCGPAAKRKTTSTPKGRRDGKGHTRTGEKSLRRSRA